MDINKKIAILEGCLSKAKLDTEYNIQVAWDNITPREVQQYINNARAYLNSMHQLDFDVREQGIANWHKKLDSLLGIFPEYRKQEDKTSKMGL